MCNGMGPENMIRKSRDYVYGIRPQSLDTYMPRLLLQGGHRRSLPILTHRGPVDLRKLAIFNTKLMSPKSWLSQEDLDAGCEHSLVPMDS